MALNKKRSEAKTNADLMLEAEASSSESNFTTKALSELAEAAKNIKPDNASEEKKKKHPGGRPTKASLGLEAKSKYSVYLKKSVYEKAQIAADERNLSFSDFIQQLIINELDDS